MIYKNSYFQKELRQAYIDDSIGAKRKSLYALLIGLVSFAVHFFLRTMSESILADIMPHLIQPSYFSTLYTYMTVSIYLYTLYYIVYYDYLSFVEIRKNRWYLLAKMGYQPLSMVFSKLAAFIYSIWFMYSCGFIFTIGLTMLIKYTFIHEYMLALYLAGLLDIIVIGVVSITLSLFIYGTKTARYIIFFFTVVLLMTKSLSGYSALTGNRILMQNALNLIDFSQTTYLLFSAAIILACTLICIFRAQNIGKYYTMPEELYVNIIPEGASVFRIEDSVKKIYHLGPKDKYDGSRIIDLVITSLFVVIICSTLVLNLFVLISSASQLSKEVTIFDHIPYIFQSDTMEPCIMKNDLALFRRVDRNEPIKTGDVVLFRDNKIVYVERVMAKEDDRYIVDIDCYPAMSQVGAMEKSLSREAIYGVFTYRSRWLGALILFANTIFGRFFLLLLPAVILFFYNPIRTFIANLIRYIQYHSEVPS
ncbi:MAG: S26 family signal peptidase [Syntrophomonadaceae bacterium]